MTYEMIAFLVGIGLFGGAWNALAGGATLFTFPALMAAGLPPVVANATNYLALLPSNAAALPAYRKELAGVGAQVLPLMIVSGLGAIAGSLLLLVSAENVFEALIPALILTATALFAFGDQIRTCLVEHLEGVSTGLVLYGALFAFSIYGGYFGAGLGIILLAVVQIMGFSSFHVANSLKNLLATSFTVLSIGVFGINGLIAWPEAGVVMCGSTLGGYFGARCARLVNERYLRVIVIGFGVVLSGFYVAKMLPGLSG